jgi:hypothetical protein
MVILSEKSGTLSKIIHTTTTSDGVARAVKFFAYL